MLDNLKVIVGELTDWSYCKITETLLSKLDLTASYHEHKESG